LITEDQTLGDVIKDMWQGKWYLLIGGAIGLSMGFALLWLAIPQYRATMLISPTTRSGGSPDIASLLPNTSGFAFEYMMRSLGPSDSSDFMRLEHILREPTVAARLLGEEKIVDGISSARMFSFINYETPKTAEQMATYLQKSLKIEPVGMTPMRRLIYLHPDSDFAVFLLHRIFAVADNIIHDEIAAKTEARIIYLNKALHNVEHPDHRKALVSLLMEQEHVRMVLAMNEAYAASVAEPASVSGVPYWPRKPFVIAISILIGVFLGYLVYAYRAKN